MKKILLLILLCYVASASHAQLIIKGRVKCMNPTRETTKGAENIIIVPAFLPSKSVITATNPSGYFEFNTGISLDKLYEKQVSLYVISQCSTCKQSVRRVFISEDQDRKNKTGGKTYFTVPEWMLEINCTRAELAAFRADSILNAISRQPGMDPDKITSSSSLLGSPVFLNFITKLVSVAGLPQNAGYFVLTSLSAPEVSYGSLLQSSPLYQSANTGFNFSPNRDYSEATLWNPSAMANSRKNNNISLFTNLKNNAKFSAFSRLTDRFTLGVGAIYTRQDEFRSGKYFETQNLFSKNVDSLKTALQEYAVYLSGAYQVNDQFSLGVAVKSAWQKSKFPYRLNYPGGKPIFVDTAITKQAFDADISASFKVSPSLQLGINVMNLAGSEFYGDAPIPNVATVKLNQRSVGLGICYKYQRWNFGADLIFTQDDFYDAAIGVNYVPFNNALLSAGIAVKQLSYSFAFRMKHFRVAYVNDEGTLTNQVRPGRLGVLGGKIYSGFVFDID